MSKRGFTQLAVELIAVEQAEFANYSMLYGAVSMGNIWQFAVLDTQQKRVIQDTNVYRVPANLTKLLQIILGILES
ncbi:MAG: hypothetical protein F6K39_20715 [Okeania sp. SIO3B3]|nr:hypothetical protein [Okeania sp. SIO3B3]